MKPRYLLYLDAHQMSAYRWRSGVLSIEEAFPASETGRQQFIAYLAKNSHGIFSLLVNVSEEGFHIETIPFLRGTDREKVIERKLEQIFFNPTLGTSLSLGSEKTRRRDERILLAALTDSVFFSPWLEIIQDTEVALSGLYSLPLLTPALLKKFRLPQEPCLLLTVQDQSIRQSYFDKGALNFSRLTPLQDTSAIGIARAFSGESIKIQQYLTSQRTIERNQTISAYILAHQSHWKAIQNSCINTPHLRYQILDITEGAKKLGLKTLPVTTHSELIFLHLLATQPPKIQFARDELLHNFQISQTRSFFWKTGVVVLVSCLLLSSKLLFDAYKISGETETLRREVQSTQQRYDDIVKTFPSVPVDNETLRAVIDRYLAQEARSTSPLGLYSEIARALPMESVIEIERLDWQIGGTDTNFTEADRQVSASGPVPDDSESLILHASIKLPPSTNPRQLLTTFNHFVDSVKTNENLRVEILQQPFDMGSGRSLRSGDTLQENNQPHSFTLQLIRKIGS